jgi:hypothetical protein
MGTIKTTNIEPIADNGTVTLGSSGDTFTIPSGVTMTVPSGGLSGQNYPSFFARKLGNQALTSDTDTKMIADDEVFDTDSAYDTSTGAFTVPTGQGGKYFFTYGFSVQNVDDSAAVAVNIKVNGSFIDGTSVLSGSYSFLNTAYNGANVDDPSVTASVLVVLSAGDYVEMWGRQRDNSTENARYLRFGAYRIGS